MLDLQQMLDNATAAARDERMKTSNQLTLIEYIYKLEAIADKTKPVFFDNIKHMPRDLDSWRGSYAELSLSYSTEDDADQTPRTVQQLLDDAKQAIGKTYQGYKGGDFLMGKNTPIWVANYGSSRSWTDENPRAIVGILEAPEQVFIQTEMMEY